MLFILRVLLTVTTAVLYCIGMTPPNPPPPPVERSKALKKSIGNGAGLTESLVRFISFSARVRSSSPLGFAIVI